jgi:predicted DNA-binding WGR domain protein
MKEKINSRYYIYVYYKVGNIGGSEVKTIQEQPEDGFETEKEAEEHLIKLIQSKKGYYFDRPWYKFTILKTWKSLSATVKKS